MPDENTTACNCRQPGPGGDCDGSCTHPPATPPTWAEAMALYNPGYSATRSNEHDWTAEELDAAITRIKAEEDAGVVHNKAWRTAVDTATDDLPGETI